jgi:hypothetical protein
MKAIAFLLPLLIAAGIAAVVYLPWWAILAGAILLVVAVKILGERLFVAALKLPFKAKGAVLRGASVEVHSIKAAAPLELKADDLEEKGSALEGPKSWYLLEVTIRPAGTAQTPFQLWGPSELSLVAATADADDTGQDGDLCDIKRVEIADEHGKFAVDDGLKYAGPQRLRLTVAASPDARNLKFRYYLELFGDLQLTPAAGQRSA